MIARVKRGRSTLVILTCHIHKSCPNIILRHDELTVNTVTVAVMSKMYHNDNRTVDNHNVSSAMLVRRTAVVSDVLFFRCLSSCHFDCNLSKSKP